MLKEFLANPELEPLQAHNPTQLAGAIRWASTVAVRVASTPRGGAAPPPPCHPSPPARATTPLTSGERGHRGLASPRQDRKGRAQERQPGPPRLDRISDGGIALAVADGHGSAAHPRSDTGAQLAVEAFLHAAAEFRAGLQPDLPLKQVKIRAEVYLPRNLVREWRQRAEDDLVKNPVGRDKHDLAATPSCTGRPSSAR